MKFVSKNRIGDSSVSVCHNVVDMVSPDAYYDSSEPRWDHAINAIFSVLSSEQKIKVAKILGYVPYADLIAYKTVRKFAKKVKELLNDCITLDFRKNEVLISDNEDELKNFSELEKLSEIKSIRSHKRPDDICRMTGHNFGGWKYSFELVDSDLKAIVENLLEMKIDLEF